MLPAVTPGCGYTREQALRIRKDCADKFWLVDFFTDDGRHIENKLALMAPWADDFNEHVITPENLEQHKRELQRYDVLVAWWGQSNG